MSDLIQHPSPSGFHDPSRQGTAYARRIDEINALSDSQLAQMSLDVFDAATTILGVLKKIAPLRAAIAALPPVDHPLIDGLEDYALAAAEANARHTTASRPRDNIAALNDQATRLRQILRADTRALCERGLIDPSCLRSFKGSVGYRNVAKDLINYAILLADNWPNIQGKSALTEAEVNHVKAIGERLLRAAGEREQAPVVIAETAAIRHRAATLMLRAYDELRRAITFLRWHERDVDRIAPSLYAGRGRRPKPPIDASAATPSAVGAPSMPNTSTTPNAVPAPGMPGASPFNR